MRARNETAAVQESLAIWRSKAFDALAEAAKWKAIVRRMVEVQHRGSCLHTTADLYAQADAMLKAEFRPVE